MQRRICNDSLLWTPPAQVRTVGLMIPREDGSTAATATGLSFSQIKRKLRDAGVPNDVLFGAPSKPALLLIAEQHGINLSNGISSPADLPTPAPTPPVPVPVTMAAATPTRVPQLPSFAGDSVASQISSRRRESAAQREERRVAKQKMRETVPATAQDPVAPPAEMRTEEQVAVQEVKVVAPAPMPAFTPRTLLADMTALCAENAKLLAEFAALYHPAEACHNLEGSSAPAPAGGESSRQRLSKRTSYSIDGTKAPAGVESSRPRLSKRASGSMDDTLAPAGVESSGPALRTSSVQPPRPSSVPAPRPSSVPALRPSQRASKSIDDTPHALPHHDVANGAGATNGLVGSAARNSDGPKLHGSVGPPSSEAPASGRMADTPSQSVGAMQGLDSPDPSTGLAVKEKELTTQHEHDATKTAQLRAPEVQHPEGVDQGRPPAPAVASVPPSPQLQATLAPAVASVPPSPQLQATLAPAVASLPPSPQLQATQPSPQLQATQPDVSSGEQLQGALQA